MGKELSMCPLHLPIMLIGFISSMSSLTSKQYVLLRGHYLTCVHFSVPAREKGQWPSNWASAGPLCGGLIGATRCVQKPYAVSCGARLGIDSSRRDFSERRKNT